jgi:hypothetical protein
MPVTTNQLRYYIALGAPPTRTPATGDEPFMRPEVGFNPSWFHEFCGIDFSEEWHRDPKVRLQSHEKMAAEIRRRFPGYNIGEVLDDKPPDLLTGTYGIGVLDLIFGRSLRYFPDRWPVPIGEPLTDAEADSLSVPDVENNGFFHQVLAQLDEIVQLTGSARGYLNWQGVLNTAFRLRGQEIFIDMVVAPERARHILGVVAETMIRGAKMLYARQREAGSDYQFISIGNCTVNMAGPRLYEQLLLPYDRKIRQEFRDFGIHNCAWTVTPYLDAYASISGVGYIDMGLDSDMKRARQTFPDARRNLLYTSMDLKNKTDDELWQDFKRIAQDLAPCDVGFPDIESDVPDDRIMFAIDVCSELSEARGD